MFSKEKATFLDKSGEWIKIFTNVEEYIQELKRIESLEKRIIKNKFIKNVSDVFCFVINKQWIAIYDRIIYCKDLKNKNKWFLLNEFNFRVNFFWNEIVFNELNNTIISFGGLNKHFVEYNFNTNTFYNISKINKIKFYDFGNKPIGVLLGKQNEYLIIFCENNSIYLFLIKDISNIKYKFIKKWKYNFPY